MALLPARDRTYLKAARQGAVFLDQRERDSGMKPNSDRSEATPAFRLCRKCSASSRIPCTPGFSRAKRRLVAESRKGVREGTQSTSPLRTKQPVARCLRYALGRFLIDSRFISMRARCVPVGRECPQPASGRRSAHAINHVPGDQAEVR